MWWRVYFFSIFFVFENAFVIFFNTNIYIALRPRSSKSGCMSASIGFLRRVSNLEMWVETGRFDIWMSCFFSKTYVNQKIGPLLSCPKNFTNKDPKTPLFSFHWHVNWGAKLERLSERWSCYPGAWDANTYSKRPAARKWFLPERMLRNQKHFDFLCHCC